MITPIAPIILGGVIKVGIFKIGSGWFGGVGVKERHHSRDSLREVDSSESIRKKGEETPDKIPIGSLTISALVKC